MAEYLYTIKDRQTDEILCQGSRRECAEYIGCQDGYLWDLSMRDRAHEKNSRYSMYKVERNVQGEHRLGGLRTKNVVCCDCGVLMENASAKRKRCPECAYKDALYQKRMRMRQRRNLEHLPPPIPSIPGREHCEGCVYFQGEITKMCAYIFIKGERRPCPPGKDCTVKIERKRYREKKERSTDISGASGEFGCKDQKQTD